MMRVESPTGSGSSSRTGNVVPPLSRWAMAACRPGMAARRACGQPFECRGPPGVRDALVVKGPAGLLVVVRHLQVPEDGQFLAGSLVAGELPIVGEHLD